MTSIDVGLRRAFTGAVHDALGCLFTTPLGHPFLIRLTTVEELIVSWLTDRDTVRAALSTLPHGVRPESVVQRLCSLVYPSTCLANSVLSVEATTRFRHVGFGIRGADEVLLRGVGFPVGTITEVSGEAGTGKTHFGLHCLFASVTAALEETIRTSNLAMMLPQNAVDTADRLYGIVELLLPISSVCAVLVVAEGAPHRRLSELAASAAVALESWLRDSAAAIPLRAALHDAPQPLSRWLRPVSPADLLDHILVKKIPTGSVHLETSISDLQRSVANVPSLAKYLRVVVIDSIAAALTTDDGDDCSGDRAPRLSRSESAPFAPHVRLNDIIRIGARLKSMAATLHVAVVALNQVRNRFGDDLDHHHHQQQSSTVPALGRGWSHCLSTRIFLQFVSKRSIHTSDAVAALSSGNTGTCAKRVATVTSSSHLPLVAWDYVITSHGIVSALPDE